LTGAGLKEENEGGEGWDKIRPENLKILKLLRPSCFFSGKKPV